MNKRRRIIPATELRVHLGEALRALEDEELVIEKGGVPVAILKSYTPAAEARSATAYERALSKRAEPNGFERMELALGAGWVGIEAEEWIERVYREREESVAGSRYFSLDEDADEDAGAGEVPSGQRYLHTRRAETTRVAEERDPEYRA